jgi:hypothetical protein
MRLFVVAGVLGCTMAVIALRAQDSAAPRPPQSARQALIEMFFGKDADDFAKHLPDEAKRSLLRKGDIPQASVVLKIASIGREVSRNGQHVETFDLGPNLLISEEEATHERIEIAVEHDSLLGEDDEIELSIHAYKNGEPQNLPIVPQLIFTLTQEKEIWRLKEVTVAAHVPLTDPDYLKGLRRQQDEADEGMAKMRVGMILAAETTYGNTNPNIGYSCDLSKLSDPGQGAEEWSGYRFTLSGCGDSPSRKYQLLAVPLDSEADTKTFCADESGKIRFLKGPTPSKCFSEGDQVQMLQYTRTDEN